MVRGITRVPVAQSITDLNSSIHAAVGKVRAEMGLEYAGGMFYSRRYLAHIASRLAVGTLLQKTVMTSSDIDALLDSDPGNTTVTANFKSLQALDLDISGKERIDRRIMHQLQSNNVPSQLWPWISKIVATHQVTEGAYMPPNLSEKFYEIGVSGGLRSHAPHDTCIAWMSAYDASTAQQAADLLLTTLRQEAVLGLRLMPATMSD